MLSSVFDKYDAYSSACLCVYLMDLLYCDRGTSVSVTTSVFSARYLSRPFLLASLLIVFEPRIAPPQSLFISYFYLWVAEVYYFRESTHPVDKPSSIYII